MASITIRDLSDNLLSAIDQFLTANGSRSREAGLRTHLERHFLDRNTTHAISKRLHDTLGYLLTMGEKGYFRFGKGISMAQIARDLGHGDTSRLDAEYRGDIPLPFEDGDKICEMLGIYRPWLESGKGTPFQQYRLFRDSLEALRDFYEKGVHYGSICLALSDEVRGEAIVYGQLSPFRYELLLSDLPLHDDVGVGGTSNLRHFGYFLAMFCNLVAAKTNIMNRAFGGTTPHTIGVILPPEQYHALANGLIHPAEVFDKPGTVNSSWYEDFADIDLPKRFSRDPGMRYTDNWTRAYKLFVKDVKSDKIDSNADLLQLIYNLYLKPLRPTDSDLAQMLKKNDASGENRTCEYYEDIVTRAKNSENYEERTQVRSLFNKNRLALPEWLERIYIEGIESLTKATPSGI